MHPVTLALESLDASGNSKIMNHHGDCLLTVFIVQVPVLHGAIIEGVATLVCRLGSRLVGMKEPKYATAIDSFIATSMVCAAFNYRSVTRSHFHSSGG